MKICPKCGANVDGLIDRCDCCGSSLEATKNFFVCALFELPQCLMFSTIARKMILEIQPSNSLYYSTFLEQVGFSLICYPKSMLLAENIKQRIVFYKKEKYASLTLLIDFNEYVSSYNFYKEHLVANAIIQGLQMLEKRLNKSDYSICEIVQHAEQVLNRYIL